MVERLPVSATLRQRLAMVVRLKWRRLSNCVVTLALNKVPGPSLTLVNLGKLTRELRRTYAVLFMVLPNLP